MSMSRPANLEETLKAYDGSPMTLTEAITLVLEPAECVVKEARVGTIGRSPRLKKAISHLRQFVEN